MNTQRTVIVRADSPLLHQPGTKRLHEYSNGEVLVRTTAPSPESVRGGEEIPVYAGLRLAGIDEPALNRARAAFTPPAKESERRERASSTPALAYVELVGPPDERWLAQLRENGVEPLRYQPENAYLCRGTVSAFKKVASLQFVVHVTPLTDELKPRVAIPEKGVEAIWIVIQGSEREARPVVAALRTIAGVEIDPDAQLEEVDVHSRIRARADERAEIKILANPHVVAVEKYEPTQPEDEVAGLIMAGQYNARGEPAGSYVRWLEDHAVSGDGVTIGIVDNGVDVSHPAYRGRVKDLNGGKKDWHGTFVAGHAAGCYLDEKDKKNFIYGLGTAPKAQLLSQNNASAAATLCRQTVTEVAPSGKPGTIQNNSWGQGTADPMTYGSLEAAYDRLVRNADPAGAQPRPLTICFSAGNSGSAGLTRPKASKNIIVTGNSENFRPDVGKVDADNINDVYSGGDQPSSYGNCGDQRIRPDVVTPGEWTSSANYDSHPGEKEYISPRLTWGGGTSGASPKTAGACALLTQWWRRHNSGRDPSPAMLRALIVNGAERITTGGHIPNNRQGWGRLNLHNVLREDVHHTYLDQSVLLSVRGERKEWRLYVSDPKKPVRVTLAWTDPPGNIGSGTDTVSAIVNKLVLRADLGGKLYRGNRFKNSASVDDADRTVANEQREGWDNLQNVFFSAGSVSGGFKVSVNALALTTNCLTGEVKEPRQDFALVITNAFLDKGSTPADVFLLIDEKAQAAATVESDDAFGGGSKSEDSDEVDSDLWEAGDAAADADPASDDASSDDGVDVGGDTDADGGDLDTATIDADEGTDLVSSDDPDGGGDLGDAGDADEAGSDEDGELVADDAGGVFGDEPAEAGTDATSTGDEGEDEGEVADADDSEGELGGDALSTEDDADLLFAAGGDPGWTGLVDEARGLSEADDDGELETTDDEESDAEFERSPAPASSKAANLEARMSTGASLLKAARSRRVTMPNGHLKSDAGWDTVPSYAVRGAESVATARTQKSADARSKAAIAEGATEPAAPISGPFSESLAKLAAAWQTFGQDTSGGPTVRRPAAVLVVGPGTRIRSRDVEVLRWLAFAGDLFLVSDDAYVLALLAQRIYRLRGVHFRLADSAEQLPRLLQDVIAEAAGAQRIEVERADGDPPTYRFSVVASDERVILQLRHQDGTPPRLQLTRPEQKGFTVEALTRREGVRVSLLPGSMQVEIDAPGADSAGAWAGEWEAEVRTTARSAADRLELVVYAVGSLRLQVSALSGPSTETRGSTDEQLVEVRGDAGVRLKSVTAVPRVIASSLLSTEAARPVHVEVQRSRLADLARQARRDDPLLVGTTEEGRDALGAETLGAALRIPRGSGGTRVLDVPVLIRGTDASGAPFARWTHSTMIRLEPRSRLRRRLALDRALRNPIAGRTHEALYEMA